MRRREVCLVVDDEQAIRRMISIVLIDLGLEVIEAADAESALEILEERNPSVIIADVRLPGMDGDEFVRSVREHDGCQAPVILISAYGEPGGHVADGYLAKPFDIDDLSETVTNVLSQ